MEPLYNGQVGSTNSVHCREVVHSQRFTLDQTKSITSCLSTVERLSASQRYIRGGSTALYIEWCHLIKGSVPQCFSNSSIPRSYSEGVVYYDSADLGIVAVKRDLVSSNHFPMYGGNRQLNLWGHNGTGTGWWIVTTQDYWLTHEIHTLITWSHDDVFSCTDWLTDWQDAHYHKIIGDNFV